MDSNDIEKERGKLPSQYSCCFNGTRINIMDNSGHVRLGGVVERIMKMVDGVTLGRRCLRRDNNATNSFRFESFGTRSYPTVVVNKIDKPSRSPSEVVDQRLEPFHRAWCR